MAYPTPPPLSPLVASNSTTRKRYRQWMVTSFNVSVITPILQGSTLALYKDFQYMVYQLEICPTTQRTHIQGYLELKRQMDFSAVKALFYPDTTVHLDARRGTRDQARSYCMKKESRQHASDLPYEIGIWLEKTPGAREDLEAARVAIASKTSWNAVITDPELTNTVARHLSWAREVFNTRLILAPCPEIELRKWQKKVLRFLNGPPVKRRIIWIWSIQSGTGKTTFFDYVSANIPTVPGADWVNTLYCYDGERVVWFDRTRSESNDDKSVDIFYRDLERWSNGSIHTSTKYVTCRKLVNAHIVVTANSEPDGSRLPQRFVTVEAKHALEDADDSDNDGIPILMDSDSPPPSPRLDD